MIDGKQELAKAKTELAELKREDPTNPYLDAKEKRVKRLELNFGEPKKVQKESRATDKRSSIATAKKTVKKVSLWDGIVKQHKRINDDN